MSSYTTPRIFTMKAGGVIAAYTFVKFGADFKHVVPCAAATDRPIGIAQNAATNVNDPVEVAYPGGGAKIIAGATVVLGQRLISDASGRGIKVAAASNIIGAIAYQDGVVGDIVAVEVTAPHEAVAADA